MAAQDVFVRELIRHGVAQTCLEVFDVEINQETLELLVDVMGKYIEELGRNAAISANASSRSSSNYFDVSEALKMMGTNPASVRNFFEKSDELPFSREVPAFPVLSSISKSGPKQVVEEFREVSDEKQKKGAKVMKNEGATRAEIDEYRRKRKRGGTIGAPAAEADEDEAPKKWQRVPQTRPKHVPSFLPMYPDQHTYRDSSVFSYRETDPAAIREAKLRDKEKLEKSLIKMNERVDNEERIKREDAKKNAQVVKPVKRAPSPTRQTGASGEEKTSDAQAQAASGAIDGDAGSAAGGVSIDVPMMDVDDNVQSSQGGTEISLPTEGVTYDEHGQPIIYGYDSAGQPIYYDAQQQQQQQQPQQQQDAVPQEFMDGYYDWEAIADSKGITDPKEREEFILKRKKKLKKKFKKWKKAQKEQQQQQQQQPAMDASGQAISADGQYLQDPNAQVPYDPNAQYLQQADGTMAYAAPHDQQQQYYDPNAAAAAAGGVDPQQYYGDPAQQQQAAAAPPPEEEHF